MVGLQATPQDLQWVRDGPGNNLRRRTDDQSCRVSQLLLALAAVRLRMFSTEISPPNILHRLIHPKLHSAVTIPKKAGTSTSVEARNTFSSQHLCEAMPHAVISSLAALIRTQHACLEYPYWIRGEGDDGPRDTRCEEIVKRSERISAPAPSAALAVESSIWLGRSFVEADNLLLNDRFEVEEDGPTASISYKVRRQAAIETLDWLRIG